jgi:hypothetical protein
MYLLLHCRSTCNISTILVAVANITALGLPIHRITFSVGVNIGFALPTTLLLMDGLRGGEGVLLLVFEVSPLILGSLEECSLFNFWLIVTWCIVLLLHPLPRLPLGLSIHLPFSFSTSIWLRRMKLLGGVDI